MKHIIFGDTGGHYQQLYNSLREIGMTEDYTLPQDICVIHLGDLVHKGLYSVQILRMIDNIRWVNPGQWIQIIGNHEGQYLGGYQFWSKRITQDGVRILNEWYDQGFLKFTHSIDASLDYPLTAKTKKEDYLLTSPLVFSHAGISLSFWLNNLSNIQPKNFTKHIEKLSLIDVHKPGIMLGEGFDINSPVGPIWAHGINEVWVMWRKFNNSTFNQIVGHIAPYTFEKNSYYPGTLEIFKESATLHEQERIVVSPLTIDESKWIFFMDPGYGKVAYTDNQPYIEIS